MGKVSKTVVGSKVAALSAEAIYSVAHRQSLVEVDSSSLEYLAQNRQKGLTILPDPSEDSLFPEKVLPMPEAEERASLVVVLHKLLQGQTGIRSFLPIFISEVLNLGLSTELPLSNDELSVSTALVRSVYKFKKILGALGDGHPEVHSEVASETELPGGAHLAEPSIALSRLQKALSQFGTGDFGVTREELTAIESSAAASVGIACLAFHTLNSLTVLADAVAATSCEALQANTESFESESFRQVFVHKSEADVASDLNSLLSKSKLVKVRKGGVDADFIQNIPAAHGAVRDSLKYFGPKLRIEINRVEITTKKKTSSNAPTALATSDLPRGSSGLSSLFENSLLSLFVSLWPNVSDSSKRMAKCLEFIREEDSESHVFAAHEQLDIAGGIRTLRTALEEASMKVASFEGNEIFLPRKTMYAVETWRKVLAMEITVALAVLSIREVQSSRKGLVQEVGIGKGEAEVSVITGVSVSAKPRAGGKPSKAKETTDRRKKDFELGEGTDVVRRYLMGHLSSSPEGKSADSQTIEIWAGELDRLLNPYVPELQMLLNEIKKVVESNESRRVPKTAKGTRDFKPEQMVIREKAFGIIVSVFKRHGAVALDTPVFELRETLMGKYGEDSKLIYDLADQGGEILSLRYDLTVPFARFLAMNKIENLKRYHIARVYRRDNPSKGRYREFYQCDFDIAGGQYSPMIPDFEVLKVLTELLDELDIGDYEVKLNHRKFLDGMLEICGVPQSKFRSICSAIDKLDKLPWDKVRKEMVEEKGLTPEVADKIGGLVQKRGRPLELLDELKREDSPFLQHGGSVAAMEELATLFKYLEASRCIHRIVFDLSLARGLDYYTGVIYEAVFKGTTQLGSIAAGGRYDNLVGMFSGKQVPAVGVSLGIERVFAIMEQQEQNRNRVVRSNQTEVMVVVVGKDLSEVAIQIATDLWTAKLKAEFVCVAKVNRQITSALNAGIPWMVIVGENELKNGVVNLKNLLANQEETIARENLVAELQNRIGIRDELPTVQ